MILAPAPPAAVAPHLPRHEILALGDSLTAAGYAELVGARFGVPVVNAGIGGQTPPQIAARYGAVPIHVSVAGGRIVAGTTPLTLVAPEILRGSDGAARSGWARIAGVLGVYSYAPGVGGRAVHSFTAVPEQKLPVAVPLHPVMTLEFGDIQSDVLLLCAGRNGGIDHPDVLLADIAAIMAAYRPKLRRIVLLGIVNAATPDEARGTPRYQAILRINGELARRYPDSFLDIRAAYNAGGDPGATEDRADRARDWPPASLRADTLHYNAAGRRVWARAVGDFIARRGWLRDGEP